MKLNKTHLNGIIDQIKSMVETARNDENFAEIDKSCLILKAIREAEDQIKEALKPLSEAHKFLKEVKIPQVFDSHNTTSITVEGYRYTISSVLRARMLDKEKGMEWLRNNELGDLIVETVNAQTLSSAAKAEEEAGRELPEEFFDVFRQPNTSITKVK